MNDRRQETARVSMLILISIWFGGMWYIYFYHSFVVEGVDRDNRREVLSEISVPKNHIQEVNCDF